MIVKMKKVSIIVYDRFREQSLKALRRLGLVHIESRPASSEELTRCFEQRALLERAQILLPEEGKKNKKKQNRSVPEADLDASLENAEEILSLTEKIRSTAESIERLNREQERLAQWGGYDPQDSSSGKDEFFDGHHPKKSSVDKAFAVLSP